MAASGIDEAIRNCVAVGADPARIAILDNFCWGYTDRPETLGSLVRAAIACHDLAVELETPFISGKDSLNNEFSYFEPDGTRQTIAIPPTLLISALGQIADVRHCVTMDLKSAGNRLFLIGMTRHELGGSHLGLVLGQGGGQVPRVNPQGAKATFAAVHRAIVEGTVAACHDLSEGGLAVAVAEMAFAGGRGAQLQLDRIVGGEELSTEERDAVLLFSESNSRFLCEVTTDKRDDFERCFAGMGCQEIGQVTDDGRLKVHSAMDATRLVIDASLAELKEAWQAPLRWE